VLVNHTLRDESGLLGLIQVRDLDGTVRYTRRFRDIDLSGNSTRQVATLPALTGLSRTYFVELELTSAERKPISRNVYWLSTQPDELDWAHSNWYLTPVTQYADLTALQSLPTASSQVRATVRRAGAEDIATVTLTVPASARTVALFQHLSIEGSAGGRPALPILWSDNDLTLWPGESLTVTAHFAPQGAGTPVVEVSGWNVPTQSVPLAMEKNH
jgi:exo-1,4-beta-D-glucosaminidase